MKVKISPKEGEVISFEPIKESFSSYFLADGNTLKIKVILLKVRRTNKKTPDGSPVYTFSTQLVSTAITSDEPKWNKGT